MLTEIMIASYNQMIINYCIVLCGGLWLIIVIRWYSFWVYNDDTLTVTEIDCKLVLKLIVVVFCVQGCEQYKYNYYNESLQKASFQCFSLLQYLMPDDCAGYRANDVVRHLWTKLKMIAN